MESWQVVLLIFFVLLPGVLMIDFWGDERLTYRGVPNRRPWVRQIEHQHEEAEAEHGVDAGPEAH